MKKLTEEDEEVGRKNGEKRVHINEKDALETCVVCKKKY